MVDQQAQLALGPVEAGGRQIRLAEGGAGHAERVDRVALAALACRAPGAGHELGRHAHHPLSSAQQVGLKAARQVAAVLQRPAPLRPLPGPAQEREVAGRGGHRGALAELPAGRIDRHQSMGALVQIGSDDHHVRCILRREGDDRGPVGGHT